MYVPFPSTRNNRIILVSELDPDARKVILFRGDGDLLDSDFIVEGYNQEEEPLGFWLFNQIEHLPIKHK